MRRMYYAWAMTSTIKSTTEAMHHLSEADPVLGSFIADIGPITRSADEDLFSSVVRHIIGQQISIAAQATIWQRMNNELHQINAATLSSTSVEALQKLGMTFRKAHYIHEYASSVNDGRFDLEALAAMDDEQAIAALMSLKGIGRWTAEMILLFGMRRADIVSFGDLAIIRGMKHLYGLEEVDRPLFDLYRSRYSPYGSVASLYLWAASKKDRSYFS